jgi:orotidine-5'-phosphate decarboxylase
MPNPIIFALDVPTIDEALWYIDILKDHVGMFKVGLELYLKEGPSIITEIKNSCDNDIFLDLKLHDIPTTVERLCDNCLIWAST